MFFLMLIRQFCPRFKDRGPQPFFSRDLFSQLVVSLLRSTSPNIETHNSDTLHMHVICFKPLHDQLGTSLQSERVHLNPFFGHPYFRCSLRFSQLQKLMVTHFLKKEKQLFLMQTSFSAFVVPKGKPFSYSVFSESFVMYS